MILETNKTSALINFIYNKLGYKVIDLYTSFDKTGIDGVDAEVFFNDFSIYFEVDMYNFDFDRYFLKENPFLDLVKNIIKYWGKQKHFTFQHLVSVVEIQKWFNPDDNFPLTKVN